MVIRISHAESNEGLNDQHFDVGLNKESGENISKLDGANVDFFNKSDNRL